MKKLLVAFAVAAFFLAQGPAFAQDKKSEPTNEESKKVDANKDAAKKIDQVQPKKEGKKKVKKGGC